MLRLRRVKPSGNGAQAATSQPEVSGTRFVPDLSNSNDALDQTEYVSGLADLIADPRTRTPMTLGVFGSWGSGKTSLMEQLRIQLQDAQFDKSERGQPPRRTLWINVWQLSLQGELSRSFLQALLSLTRREMPLPLRIRFDLYLLQRRLDAGALLRQLAMNGYRAVVALSPAILAAIHQSQPANPAVPPIDPTTGALASVALTLWLVIKPAIEAIGPHLTIDLGKLLKQAPYEAQITLLQRLQEDFSKLIEIWMGATGRLVVFIDDLDRCPPHMIPGVLESLKLFTTTECCVYVLALDREVISRSLHWRYRFSSSPTGETAVDGIRYLEKVVQLPFVLPSIETRSLHDYIKSFNVRWPDERCADVFASGLAPNPRGIKRAVNVFLLLWELAERRRKAEKIGATITALRLAKFVALQTAYPAAFEELTGAHDQLRSLEMACRGTEPATTLKGRVLELIDQKDVKDLLQLFAGDESAGFGVLDDDSLDEFFSLTRSVPVAVAPQEEPVAEPTSTVIRPQRIPAAVPDLTGREDLLSAVAAAAADRGNVGVLLVGMPGIGKTQAAFASAGGLGGRFADAVFVDLKGSSSTPLAIPESMSQILRALRPDVDPPAEPDALAAVYRSVVQSRSILLLLDDAANESQVQALLPARPSFTILTAREFFSLPGVLVQKVDPLSEDDALILLRAIAPQLDAEHASEIAALCGRLPFGLRVAGNMLASRPDLGPEEFTRRLRDEPSSRGAVADQVLAVSYTLLETEVKILWRRLAVFPDSFATDAAAAIWEKNVDTADDDLANLVARSLVLFDTQLRRYQLHALSRVFLESRLEPEERVSCQRRHGDHYLSVLTAANRLYLAGGQSVTAALLVIDLELPNLRAAFARASERSHIDTSAAELCSAFADVGAFLLPLRQTLGEQIAWLKAAIEAAEYSGDQERRAALLGQLGVAHARRNDFALAETLFREQLDVSKSIGDRVNEGVALGNLGILAKNAGDGEQAVSLFAQQLAIAEQANDDRARGQALSNLGGAYRAIEATDHAIQTFEQALALRQQTGDLVGEAVVWRNLADLNAQTERHEQAFDMYRRAWELQDRVGDRAAAAQTLANWAQALHEAGRTLEAVQHGREALEIFIEQGDPFATTLQATLAAWQSEPRPNDV